MCIRIYKYANGFSSDVVTMQNAPWPAQDLTLTDHEKHDLLQTFCVLKKYCCIITIIFEDPTSDENVTMFSWTIWAGASCSPGEVGGVGWGAVNCVRFLSRRWQPLAALTNASMPRAATKWRLLNILLCSLVV